MTERNIPMTAYPPQPPARKLTRSRSDKMLGGVCAGVANYLNMDVNLVRILTVVLSLFTGVPIIAYVVMLLVVPEEDVAPYVPQPGPQTTDPVWGPQGAPWDGSAPGPVPSPEPGPAPTAPDAPAASEPAPNEADPTPETPLEDHDPVESAPGEESTWESTPADGETKPEDKPEDKKD